MNIKNKLKRIFHLITFNLFARGNMDLLMEKFSSMENELVNLKLELSKVGKNYNYVNLETLQLSNFYTTGKKKILLAGFYGAINLGDELMLETLLKIIDKNNDYDITIMLCDNQNIDITRYGKYNFIHYPLNETDFNVLANYFDCIIFGGGAIIDDVDYEKHSTTLTLGRILVDLSMRFIAFDKKVILYGLSTNAALKNQEFIKKFKYIVEHSTYISLRDSNSIKVLKKNKINTEKVHLVDDIVFSNTYLTKKNRTNSCLKIGVVFICSSDTEEQITKYLKQVIQYAERKKKRYSITLIPFYNYRDNDNQFYNRIVHKIGNPKVVIADFPNNMEELQNTLNNNDYIISMRYHATLIANLMHKKVLNIVYTKHRHYENKMKYLYENYKFEYNSIVFGESIKSSNFKVLFDKYNKGEYQDCRQQALKDIEDMIQLIDPEKEKEESYFAGSEETFQSGGINN